MNPEIVSVLDVGQKLVDYCNDGKFRQAIEELYADDAKHVEAADCGPEMPQVSVGKAKLLENNEKWDRCHEVHSMEIKGPYPHSNGSFAVLMTMDVTVKEGPMAGKRMELDEVCRYLVKDGKISEVEFYWDPSGYEM